MKALILAAGFGTRLEESFQKYTGHYKAQLREWVAGKPKGLVIIKGKPVVQYQLEQLLSAGIEHHHIFVHTNDVYYSQYLSWARSVGLPEENIFNNTVRDNEHRLGAVGDLRYALERIPQDDIIVMASDTLLFSGEKIFNLQQMVQTYFSEGVTRIMIYEGEHATLSRYGIVQIDPSGTVIGFEEKPSQPKSNLVNASVHIYTKEIVDAILQSPLPDRAESGQVVAYLYPHFPIKAEKTARRVDIGTVEDVLRENVEE